MEDNIGFRKKPRPISPQAVVQVVDNTGGSRPGGKAGGHKGGTKSQPAPAKPVGMRVVAGRSKKPAPDVSDHISRQLKAVYDDIVSQPVPSRFIDLLSKLDEDSDR
jgi:Anti-sigma factor NepR